MRAVVRDWQPKNRITTPLAGTPSYVNSGIIKAVMKSGEKISVPLRIRFNVEIRWSWILWKQSQILQQYLGLGSVQSVYHWLNGYGLHHLKLRLR